MLSKNFDKDFEKIKNSFELIQHCLLEFGIGHDIKMEDDETVVIFGHNFEGKYNLESLAPKMNKTSATYQVLKLLETEKLSE